MQTKETFENSEGLVVIGGVPYCVFMRYGCDDCAKKDAVRIVTEELQRLGYAVCAQVHALDHEVALCCRKRPCESHVVSRKKH